MILQTFLFLFIHLLHPLHLSVCDISHKPSNQSLEITQRLFVDDLEDALRSHTGERTDVLNPENPELMSKLIGDYLLQNFSLYLNKKEVELRYLGYEVEEDAVWVFLEVPKVRDFKSITVKNTVFFEMFDDQLNLINVEKEGNIRSLKLVPENGTGRLSY